MKNELQVMILNSITNIFLSVMKIVVGLIFKSQLLIADGIHSASDLLTDLFSIIGLKLSERPKDEAHPFGHGKLEYVASITVAMLIFFVTYNLVRDVISEWNDLSTDISWLVITVAVVTLVVKFMLSSYVLKKGNEWHSLTLKNSGLESRTDALSTIIVIIGLVLAVIGNRLDITLLMYGEKVATIFVVGFLIKAAGEIYFNSMVGIAGTHAAEEIRDRYIGLLEENRIKYFYKDFIVMNEGTHYAVAMVMIFDEDTSLKEAFTEKERIKAILLSNGEINKVSIDFTTELHVSKELTEG